MICQKCKTETASVCISQTVDTRKTDIYLCKKCADNAAFNIKAAFDIFGTMPGHLAFGADNNAFERQPDGGRCESCGISFAEIQKGGKLGCAGCYTAFRSKLRPIVTRIHRSAQHRGKNPYGADAEARAAAGAPADAVKRAEAGMPGEAEDAARTGADRRADAGDDGDAQKNADKIAHLKALLTEAVREEEYEQAAALRDQIKALTDGTVA